MGDDSVAAHHSGVGDPDSAIADGSRTSRGYCDDAVVLPVATCPSAGVGNSEVAVPRFVMVSRHSIHCGWSEWRGVPIRFAPVQ